MDTSGVGDWRNWFALLCVFVTAAVGLWWRRKRLQQTSGWPTTELTIHSGRVEIISASEYHEIRAPVFAFSYKVADEYYAGRFSLNQPQPELVESLIPRMIGRTLQVRYNPRRPEQWFIPVKQMEGCTVGQKMV